MPLPRSPAPAGARLVTEPLRGIWPATAAGFDAASGDLLARLDADSVPAPGWLAEVEHRMSRPDRPTVVTGSGVFYGANGVIRWIARNIYIGGYFTVIGALLAHPPVFGSNYAMRRDAWLELRDLVHRDRGDVHDDLDLSWWIQPGMTVVRDDALLVGVSARPFDSPEALWRRVRMAFHTLAIEFRAWGPLERRAAHWRARRARQRWVGSERARRRRRRRRRGSAARVTGSRHPQPYCVPSAASAKSASMSRTSWCGAVSHGLCPVW